MGKAVGAILFILVFVWDLLTDFRKWETGEDVNHTAEFIIRVGLLIPSVLLLAGFEFRRIPENWYWRGAATTLLLGSVWLLFFDGLYNTLRGFGWWFNGSIDGGDSFFDLLLMRLKDWQEAILKIGLVIAGFYFYIKTSTNEKN